MTLIQFDSASFQQRSQKVLTDLTWQLQTKQQWAVVGPVGAGKTSLLRAIAGKLVLTGGDAIWTVSPEDVHLSRFEQLRRYVALVSFREEAPWLLGENSFYQQRYHAGLDKTTIRLRDFLNITDSLDPWLERLQLTGLLDSPVDTLSNGQTRRALLAKALLKQPRLLLLDEPFMGLDAHFRAELAAMLTDIIETGTQIVLVTDANGIPDSITHVAELNSGTLTYAGPKQDYKLREQEPSDKALPELHQPLVSSSFSLAFQLTDVSVRYGEKIILDQINWTIKRGEKWALLGHNGAGKSVLLSLLYGDHPQAYANDIWLFDRKRGAGESIWDIKKRIGFVSPELHLYFRQPLSCRAVALSGLTDSLTAPRQVSEVQEQDRKALFDYFDLETLAEQSFQQVSTGQQRLILLIRALLKQAPCLILDEPFQALDPATVQRARRLLMQLRPEQTLLFVTHYLHEIPDNVDQVLNLRQGKALVQPLAHLLDN